MIYCRNRKLGFVHMPKTGGTWVSHVLTYDHDFISDFGQHAPSWDPRIRRLVALHKYRIIGAIRNPFPWYVSLYCHCLTSEAYEPTLRHYGQGSMEFRDVLYGWTHAGEIPGKAPDPVGVIWSPVAEGRGAFAASGVGLASWAVRYWYGDCNLWQLGTGKIIADRLMVTDHLREDLGEELGLDYPIATPPINTRDHPPVDRWYDLESTAWVICRDSWMSGLIGEL